MFIARLLKKGYQPFQVKKLFPSTNQRHRKYFPAKKSRYAIDMIAGRTSEARIRIEING
jgi:hypothetical protein